MLRASSYMNMGIAAGQAGNLGVSIPALYRAVEAHPEMVEAYVNLGKAMQMSNRPEDAIACYEAALQIEPNLSMVDAALGETYALIGDRQRAIYHFERAILIDPTDIQSIQLLEALRSTKVERTPVSLNHPSQQAIGTGEKPGSGFGSQRNQCTPEHFP